MRGCFEDMDCIKHERNGRRGRKIKAREGRDNITMEFKVKI